MFRRSAVTLFFLLSVGLLSAQAPSGRAIGPIMARVKMDVYSDFQCPHCKALFEQTLNHVKQDYAVPGKIRLVHHDFPLAQHQYAKRAALLAEAADRIGKWDEVAAALFRQQDAWAENGKVEEAADSVLTPAEAKRVHDLADDPSVAAVVQRDIDLGTRLQVAQTPTIFLSKDLQSNRIPGFVTYGILKRYLDQLIAQ